MPRFFCPEALAVGHVLDLPAGAARHVQVLRMQPGQAVTLFNGGAPGLDATQAPGGEFAATILAMGRTQVQVRVDAHHAAEREAARTVHLAVGMPANERMDWLVEKAAELGVASIQPLMSARSVLRLEGERAEKKRQHWQAIAAAACEQCGGNRVPPLHPVRSLREWLGARAWAPAAGMVLSLQAPSQPLPAWMATPAVPLADGTSACTLLIGPEGGLAPEEDAAARAAGLQAVALGARVLRTETAALAALALLGLGNV